MKKNLTLLVVVVLAVVGSTGCSRRAVTVEERIGTALERLLEAGADREMYEKAESDLAAVGELAIPKLTHLLQHEDLEVRARAASTLTRMRSAMPEETIQALMQAANNPKEREIRYAAGSKPYMALVRLGRAAVPVLLESLESEHADIRLQAIEALSAIGPNAKVAIPNLIHIVRNRQFTESESMFDQAGMLISSDAGGALSEIGEAAIPALSGALRDDRELSASMLVRRWPGLENQPCRLWWQRCRMKSH